MTATRLMHAKNEAAKQPAINLQIAKAYLAATDESFVKRTWREVMVDFVKVKSGSNHPFFVLQLVIVWRGRLAALERQGIQSWRHRESQSLCLVPDVGCVFIQKSGGENKYGDSFYGVFTPLCGQLRLSNVMPVGCQSDQM